MKKVLITCVGNRDPFSESNGVSEGAVLTSVRFFNPDYVYLMPTSNKPKSDSNTYEKALETEKEIKAILNCEVFIKPLDIKNPTDYTELRKAYISNLDMIYEDIGINCEIYNSISSGTSQMQTIWLILKNNGFLKGKLYQIIDPKFTTCDEPDKRIKEIVMDWFAEDSLIQNSIIELNSFSFENAGELMKKLSEITSSTDRNVFGEILSDLFRSYALWDNLQYNLAFDKISKVKVKVERFNAPKDIQSFVQIQYELLGKLRIAEHETKDILLDLYFNLKRRKTQNNYPDTLARLWRIYEAYCFFLMRRNYKVNPLDLTNSEDKQYAKKLISDFQLKPRNKHFEISRERIVFDIWKYNNSKEWNFLQRNMEVSTNSGTKQSKSIYDCIEHLRETRNNSIVAHGLKPISETEALQCVEVAKELLLTIEEIDKSEFENFPLSENQITEASKFIKTIH